jgi:spermidine synthase
VRTAYVDPEYETIPVVYTIYSVRSPYQKIELGVIKNRVALLLDGKIQFIYPEEKFYHKALIDEAVKLIGRVPKRVLILGGGDGLAARRAIDIGASEVVVVELDPKMIEVFSTNPLALSLNKGVFKDRRVKVIIGDAYYAPYMGLGQFDLIAVDLTDPDKNSAHLYSREYLMRIADMVNIGGVISGYNQKELGEGKYVGGIPVMRGAKIYYWKRMI